MNKIIKLKELLRKSGIIYISILGGELSHTKVYFGYTTKSNHNFDFHNLDSQEAFSILEGVVKEDNIIFFNWPKEFQDGKKLSTNEMLLELD